MDNELGDFGYSSEDDAGPDRCRGCLVERSNGHKADCAFASSAPSIVAQHDVDNDDDDGASQ